MGCAVPVYAADLKTSDTIYNPLPLYHSSAGILCCGPSFYIGLSVALKKKFSAKEYWKDCVKYNATVIILDNFISDKFLKTESFITVYEKYHRIFSYLGRTVHWRDL